MFETLLTITSDANFETKFSRIFNAVLLKFLLFRILSIAIQIESVFPTSINSQCSGSKISSKPPTKLATIGRPVSQLLQQHNRTIQTMTV